MYFVFCLLWFVGFMLAEENTNSLLSKDGLQCGVQHRGFHVKLHCNIQGTAAKTHAADCILRLYLPEGFFLDPYEFVSRYPKINFTISKSVSNANPSGLSKWFSWFMGSGFPKRNEIMINQSQVDLEAPQWLAEPMAVYFRTNKMPYSSKDNMFQIEVPLHLRYHLPSYENPELSVTQVSLPYPSLTCSNGYSFNNLEHMSPFPMDVVVPHTNDLIYVMPLTILFLTVGVVVLLLA